MIHARSLRRRDVLSIAGGLLVAPLLARRLDSAALPALKINGFELIPVRATSRTVWLFVRLRTDAGLTGLGEASDAFGFANTTTDNVAAMRAQLATLFTFIDRGSPFDVERFRQRGWKVASSGLVGATAFSAIEQAMWDLAGKALDVPSYALIGGKVRDTLPVYANINRATNPRTAAGFADAARRAVGDGFRAIKAAPWDGFPAAGSPAADIEKATENGIAAAAAMREAVGSTVAIMLDCHSFFDVERAVRVAQRLEPYNLAWYEEPVAPEKVDETLAIKRRIRQQMAGGEVLFGMSGFGALIERRAVDVIMPDVKHCGGLLELTRIAAAAAVRDVLVSPHNPSGPVSTAASVQAAAGAANVNLLELQYGEVPWRADVLSPPEQFINGEIRVPDRPGFGIELNESTIKARALAI